MAWDYHYWTARELSEFDAPSPTDGYWYWDKEDGRDYPTEGDKRSREAQTRRPSVRGKKVANDRNYREF